MGSKSIFTYLINFICFFTCKNNRVELKGNNTNLHNLEWEIVPKPNSINQLALQQSDCICCQMPQKPIILREKGLNKIPANFSDTIEYIDYLDLAMNPITTIGDDISKFTSLVSLKITFSEIDSISCNIVKLEKLKCLDLLANNLEFLPDCICELDSIEYLNLTDNPLNALPKCISNLKTLKRLAFSYNEDGKLPISNVDSLRILMPNCYISY